MKRGELEKQKAEKFRLVANHQLVFVTIVVVISECFLK